MHVTSPRNIDRPRSDKKNVNSKNNEVVDQSVKKIRTENNTYSAEYIYVLKHRSLHVGLQFPNNGEGPVDLWIDYHTGSSRKVFCKYSQTPFLNSGQSKSSTFSTLVSAHFKSDKICFLLSMFTSAT